MASRPAGCVPSPENGGEVYGKDRIIYADGTSSTQTYDALTDFKDGKAVVRVDSKTIRRYRHHRQDPVEHEFCV